MIVYCCADLIFATKISSTAETLGVPTRPSRNAEMLRKRLERVDDGKLNEPVTAVFVDLDLEAVGLAMIEQVKAFDKSIPVVAFGAHVATEILQGAKDRGAEFVMPRGSFTANLPALLERFGKGATNS